jgi:intein-encoded DNA endonuclease-like protein
MDLGIMPNKSTKEKIPVIREELHRDFIRGVFDGDGCFHTPNPYRGIFSIVGSYDVVSYIAKYLRKELNIPVSFRLQKGSLYFMAVYRYENVRAVLDWLYDDSTTFLDRKYNHYINWLASKLSPEERTKEIGLKISRNSKILRGEESPRAKLTESKVREIMRLRTEDALTYKNIASMFGVRCSTIQSVLNGNTWSHITGLENARVKYRREE